MRNPRRLPLLLGATLVTVGVASVARADTMLDADAGAMIIVAATRDAGYLAARTSSATRTDTPLLTGEGLTVGVYELVFEAGAYLRSSGQALGEVLFLDAIPIRFGVPDAGAHYHVPLLISPFAYSTYRGS